MYCNSNYGSVYILNIIMYKIYLFLVAEEKKIFLRERSNNLYSVPAYFFSKICCEIPIFFITTNCLIALIYPLTNLNDTFSYKYYMFSKYLLIKINKMEFFN